MMSTDELYLRLNGSPQAVLAKIKEIEPKVRRAERRRKWLRGAALSLFVAGPLLLVWALKSPRVAKFALAPSIVMVVVGILAIRRPYVPYPHFEAAQEILSTLRDDTVRVVGFIDLTRPDAMSKRVGVARSGSGKRKAYYRNPWLQIKLDLLDGNTLRLSLVDKIKTKSNSVVRHRTEITAKLSINSDLYTLSEAIPKGRTGGLEVSSGPDHIRAARYGVYSRGLSVEQLLSMIQKLYSYLEPVGQVAV